MSHFLIGAGREDKESIALSTRQGSPIENFVMPFREISAFAETNELGKLGFDGLSQQARGLLKRAHPRDTTYNCVGMVFGARRVHIHPDQIPLVLREDGYRQVEAEDILVGDVITWESEDGDFEHIGTVIEVELRGGVPLPRVLSKWSQLAEYVHPPHIVPSLYGRIIRYWRISRAATSLPGT